MLVEVDRGVHLNALSYMSMWTMIFNLWQIIMPGWSNYFFSNVCLSSSKWKQFQANIFDLLTNATE